MEEDGGLDGPPPPVPPARPGLVLFRADAPFHTAAVVAACHRAGVHHPPWQTIYYCYARWPPRGFASVWRKQDSASGTAAAGKKRPHTLHGVTQRNKAFERDLGKCAKIIYHKEGATLSACTVTGPTGRIGKHQKCSIQGHAQGNRRIIRCHKLEHRVAAPRF